MEEINFSFGDIIFECGKSLNKLYIVISGRVQLRQPLAVGDSEIGVQPILSDDQKELRKCRFYNGKLKTPKVEQDICIRETSHMVGEEHVFMRGLTNYKAVVISSNCAMASIPFSSVRLTLATYDMYLDEVRDRILQRFILESNLRADIKARGLVGQGLSSDVALESKNGQMAELTQKIASIPGVRSPKYKGLTVADNNPKASSFDYGVEKTSKAYHYRPKYTERNLTENKLGENMMTMQDRRTVEKLKESLNASKNASREEPKQFAGVNRLLTMDLEEEARTLDRLHEKLRIEDSKIDKLLTKKEKKAISDKEEDPRKVLTMDVEEKFTKVQTWSFKRSLMQVRKRKAAMESSKASGGQTKSLQKPKVCLSLHNLKGKMFESFNRQSPSIDGGYKKQSNSTQCNSSKFKQEEVTPFRQFVHNFMTSKIEGFKASNSTTCNNNSLLGITQIRHEPENISSFDHSVLQKRSKSLKEVKFENPHSLRSLSVERNKEQHHPCVLQKFKSPNKPQILVRIRNRHTSAADLMINLIKSKKQSLN